jgi:sterol desaturase/sphingolipid hydroxylase (fatty acid hydroxylase superfamily)
MTIVALIFFIIFEQVFKRFKNFDLFSKDQGENFIWISLTEFIFESLISAGKFYFVIKINSIFKYLGVYQVDISHLNQFFQASVYLTLYTFIQYIMHYLLHHIPIFWNFHKLHHSTNELTASATLRGHFVETILLDGISLGLVNLFMYDQPMIEWVNLFLIFWTFFLHTNTKINLSFFKFILITPHDHLWHHAKDCKIKAGQNFGGIFSFWDRLFKTYYTDASNPESGLHEEYPSNYILKLFNPFINR